MRKYAAWREEELHFWTFKKQLKKETDDLIQESIAIAENYIIARCDFHWADLKMSPLNIICISFNNLFGLIFISLSVPVSQATYTKNCSSWYDFGLDS